jgi:hypothetical protein
MRKRRIPGDSPGLERKHIYRTCKTGYLSGIHGQARGRAFMTGEPRPNRIVFEDGSEMAFNSISFEPHSIVVDGKVFLYSQVDEVHLRE